MGKALVVYESMWGNTEKVARAVAAGLASWLEVEVCEVGAAPAVTTDVDLLVIGAPTHAFSMSRASTRQDAGAAAPARGATGLREWLDESAVSPPRLATFDTRVEKVRHLPGSAAKSAARVAHHTVTPAPASRELLRRRHRRPARRRSELVRASAWGRRTRRRRQGRSAKGGASPSRRARRPGPDRPPRRRRWSTVGRPSVPYASAGSHRPPRPPPLRRPPPRPRLPSPGVRRQGADQRQRDDRIHSRTAPATAGPWSPADLSDQARPTNRATTTRVKSENTAAMIMRSSRPRAAARKPRA